jgi:serine/threonine protein phosphatase 1
MKTQLINLDDKRFVYVVGDIHGEIDKLNECLHDVGFDKSQDLILSVGDLIDRGDDSLSCLKLINESWFVPVMGNHEKMAFDALNEKTDERLHHWIMNGGDWFLGLNDDDKATAVELIKKAGDLPYLIEATRGDKKIVICHADYPSDDYDINKEGIEMHTLWSRERIHNLKRGETSNINGADLFIFGHTPVKQPFRVENQLYIDTGAVFGNELTMVNIDDL